MTSPDAALTHGNLLEYTRWCVGLEDGTRMHDADGTLAVAFTTDWPSSRQAIRSDEAVGAATWIPSADEFLAGLGHTACIFVRDGVDDDANPLLDERGYNEFGRVPSMICDAIPDERASEAGVEVRLADSAADVAAYARVAGKAFVDLGLLEEPTCSLLDNPALMLADDVILAVGQLEGEIVAGAFVKLVSDGASGYVSFVSVLDSARGRALGDAVTRRVTREAFDRGAGTLSLEASKFGANTYRRMGYRDLFEYRLMIRIDQPDG